MQSNSLLQVSPLGNMRRYHVSVHSNRNGFQSGKQAPAQPLPPPAGKRSRHANELVAAGRPGGAIFHVHAKDTLLNAPVQATTSLLENSSLMDIPARSWSYITLGFGHGETWWGQFCYRFRMASWLARNCVDAQLGIAKLHQEPLLFERQMGERAGHGIF